MNIRIAFFCFLLILVAACKPQEKVVLKSPIEPISPWVEVQILHVNDVYEIGALSGGKIGGMARVATLRKELLAKNPNTLTVLAGDFLNPSAIGSVKLDGQRVKGAQMVDVMNAVGFDFVVFGNHEFDLKEHELQARLDESDFEWFAGNIRRNVDNSVEKFITTKNGEEKSLEDYGIFTIESPGGKSFKLGVLTTCLDFNKKDYVHYMDVYSTAEKQFKEVQAKSDAVIAVTHLNLDQDQELARRLPEIEVIMGGHEHHLTEEMENNIPILKADANAKSAIVHTIRYNTETKDFQHSYEVVQMNNAIALDPVVAALVKEWEDKAYAQFLANGYDVNEIVYSTTEFLDGREHVIRNGPTNLGSMIAEAASDVSYNVDAVFINAGSIRIDDKLTGDLTQLDIIRCLPFGGGIVEVEMAGSVLRKTLNAGLSNADSGGYLHWHNIELREDEFYIGGKKLDDMVRYKIATSDFLMTGQEKNMDFLTSDSPGIYAVNGASESEVLKGDIRKAFIAYLQK